MSGNGIVSRGLWGASNSIYLSDGDIGNINISVDEPNIEVDTDEPNIEVSVEEINIDIEVDEND